MVNTPTLPGWLAQVYPFSPGSFVTPGGARMSYLDEGVGTPVLMLHGNPTWSFFYRNLVTRLKGSHRCIVPDHVGMGLSEKPQDYPYTLETRIADIEALVDSLGLKRFQLVVHDWGGAIGFGLAGRRPECVERIVILNTAAFALPFIPRRIALCRMPLLGALVVRGFNGFAWPATWMSMAGRSLSPVERRGYLHPYSSWADRVAVHQFVRDIPMERGHRSEAALAAVEANLPRLSSVPKLIVWGGRDFCFDDRFFSEWCRRFPDAGQLRFENAGHYVLDDAGAPALQAIEQFLSQHP